MAAAAKAATAALGAFALGEALAGKVARTVKKIGKKKTVKIKKKNSQLGVSGVGLNSARLVNAPTTFGIIRRGVGTTASSMVPFSSSALSLKVVWDGAVPNVRRVYFHNEVTSNFSQYGQGLNPSYNGANDTNSIGFSSAVLREMSKNFVLWRFRKLKLQWNPLVGTSSPPLAGLTGPQLSTSPNVSFGYIPEGAPSPSTVPNYDSILTLSSSLSGPAWCPMEMDLTSHLQTGPCGGFYYIDGNQGSSESDLRQECQGSLFGTIIGDPGDVGGGGSSQTYGFVTLSGILELKDIASDLFT